MVMHHHLTNPWEVASFFCSASDHGMQTRFGGRLSRVEGGLKAALHDAATPHHTTPPHQLCPSNYHQGHVLTDKLCHHVLLHGSI
jgi:hypothetical protein